MIDLPDKFKLDIESKVFDLTPLVIIDDRIRLSTKKVFVEQNFDPLIKKVGSINQSVDASEKKFKISSVNIDLFNIDYSESPSNQTFSEKLFNPSIMNKKVEIYHKSQSGESLGDCLKVYSGFVKDIEERTDFLSIRVEDQAEKTLHKKLPIEYVRDDIGLPDKYKNKRVPMVYGYVENAPCVYYNIYESAIENGGGKYSIIPDSFDMQLVEKPKVFDNDIYLDIRPTCILFADQSEDTLYESTEKEQFNILSNVILVDRTLNVGGETVGDIDSYDGTPISYNMVEIIHRSPVVFTGGTYDVHYEGNKKSTNVQMFEDIAGNTPSSSVSGSYLSIKDFADIPSDIASYGWLYGSQNTLAGHLGYENIYGETILNFEATQFATENKVVQALPTASGDKIIKGWVGLVYTLEAEVTLVVNPPVYPHLFFRWVDQSAEVWDVTESDDDGAGIFKKSGDAFPQEPTNDLTNKGFSILQRQLIEGKWKLVNSTNGDAFKYLKLDNLEIQRYAILNDFISYDIYADVYGRVDNVAGSYTGTEQFTLSQRQDYFEGRLNTGMRASQTQRLAKRPVAKQIKKPVKPSKQPTIKKQKIKTRTKY
tara:strand:- start:2747 stop:4531 length:1785 start_codon:yes stop_codon:yes gene_type:complete